MSFRLFPAKFPLSKLKPARQRPVNRQRKLAAESLESRRVLSAVALTDGLLAIEGDARPNVIEVSVNDETTRLRVSVDGRTADFDNSLVDKILVSGGDGNDSIRLSDNVRQYAELDGGNGNDRIRGSDQNTLIRGGRGDDAIHGGGGADLIEGGPGNDRIFGGTGNDVLFGGLGNDRIAGGRGDDYLIGGSGNDGLQGGVGDDWIFGDATNEYPEGASDPIAYAREFMNENRGNDVLRGGDGDDILLAGNGNDRVSGGKGDDVLDGGRGRDLLTGGEGADLIRARDGSVDYVIADRSDELQVDRDDIIRGLF